jgi:hypothetical protein
VIAAGDAARRVHEHVVADAVAFGKECLQDAQRAVVRVVRQRARAVAAVAQR